MYFRNFFYQKLLKSDSVWPIYGWRKAGMFFETRMIYIIFGASRVFFCDSWAFYWYRHRVYGLRQCMAFKPIFFLGIYFIFIARRVCIARHDVVRSACALRCVSVRLSVTLEVYWVETTHLIIKQLALDCSLDTIVYRYQTWKIYH